MRLERVGGRRAFGAELVAGGGVDVVDHRLVAALHQAAGDVGAHAAEADDTDLHACSYSCAAQPLLGGGGVSKAEKMRLMTDLVAGLFRALLAQLHEQRRGCIEPGAGERRDVERDQRRALEERRRRCR